MGLGVGLVQGEREREIEHLLCPPPFPFVCLRIKAGFSSLGCSAVPDRDLQRQIHVAAAASATTTTTHVHACSQDGNVFCLACACCPRARRRLASQARPNFARRRRRRIGRGEKLAPRKKKQAEAASQGKRQRED